MKNYINKILEHKDLDELELIEIFSNILDNSYDHEDVKSFLLALNNKSDLFNEIKVLRNIIFQHANKIEGFSDAVDMCGTGGDCLNYFNVSTTTAFVVASSGLKVAKHGNRGVSSKSGSSDVLEALGINILQEQIRVEECLKQVGIAFLFAPLYHPILKNVAEVRKKIGKRTIFNILGPLLNPAKVNSQLIGVYDFEIAKTMCKVLKENGSKNVIIVNGPKGADEITCLGKTKVCELKNGVIKEWIFDPKTVGLYSDDEGSLIGKDAKFNADEIIRLLNGKKSSFYNTVVLNAAFVFYLKNLKNDIQECVNYAEELITTGKAFDKFNQFKNFK
ncbi:MAG: anthranilate phosphoribosyltransferase [Rickettsiales bacterium]|nr:anthranilate phosphoribosyltransferase [Rickettsiales bacterium]